MPLCRGRLIVVLCAYLGQLARLRDALAGEVAVVIDERDQAALDDREGDQDDAGDAILTTSIQRVKVTSRVRCRPYVMRLASN